MVLQGIFIHTLDVTPSCYLDMLERLQKQVYRAVGFTLGASLEPLFLFRNIVQPKFFL